MNKLYRMTHASLVNLTIHCSDQHIANRVLHLGSVLNQFPLLEHLSLTCPILYQYSQQPRMALWDTTFEGTHERLVDLHIDLYGNKYNWYLPLELAVMHLPHLRRLSIHPRDYDEPSRIIQALMEYCAYIDTISVFVESADDPLHYDVSRHPSTIKSRYHYQQQHHHHQDLRHLFLQDTAAHSHIVSPIIHKHSSTLETLALRASHTSIHRLLTSVSDVTMPRLRTVRLLNQQLSFEQPDIYDTVGLYTLFARHPDLERVAVLDNPCFTNDALQVLCNHHLCSLELQCCDISQMALSQFFSACGARSTLSKLVLIDIAGVTDNILDLVKQLPNLKHVTLLKNKISFSAVVSFLEDGNGASDANKGKRYDYMGLECTKSLGQETATSYTTEDILAMLDRVATVWHFQYQEQ